jgi:hypothetical protein
VEVSASVVFFAWVLSWIVMIEIMQLKLHMLVLFMFILLLEFRDKWLQRSHSWTNRWSLWILNSPRWRSDACNLSGFSLAKEFSFTSLEKLFWFVSFVQRYWDLHETRTRNQPTVQSAELLLCFLLRVSWVVRNFNLKLMYWAVSVKLGHSGLH